MRRTLIASEYPFWRNTVGVIAAVILVPIALFVKLITMPFERPYVRTADEVARYLRNYLSGRDKDCDDFDDFTSIPIKDAALESIRQRAARVEEPISEDGRKMLRELLTEAEDLAARSRVMERHANL